MVLFYFPSNAGGKSHESHRMFIDGLHSVTITAGGALLYCVANPSG